MILRPYQSAALESVREALDSRPVLVLPTGAGKTFVAASLIAALGKRTLWMCHRRELVSQAAQALARQGLEVGILAAGMDPRPRAQVQVASVQTLTRRDKPPAEVLFIDECHHARAKTYGDIIACYPGAPIVGLTASPFRLDGRGLGDVFGTLVVGAYPDDLCADGTLIEPVVYAPSPPGIMDGVHIQHGEYNLKESSERMRKAAIVGDLVATWHRHAEGKRTVLFAPTVAVSKEYVEAFRLAGVKIEHLDGKTPKAQRDAILHRLRIGYTTIVSNVAVVEEGFDLPTLDCAIVARPTASLCLHLQMIGRIMRAADGKGGAIVLDHAGNHLRHGPVTQRLAYSLADRIGGQGTGAKGAAMRRCPKCFLMMGPAVPECPACGHVFTGREIARADGELVPYVPGAQRPRPSIDEQQRAWGVLESQRIARGYREAWTYFRFEDRFGFRPLVWQGAVCDPSTVSHEVKHGVFRNLEAAGIERGLKPGWAAHRYREIFGAWPPFERRSA